MRRFHWFLTTALPVFLRNRDSDSRGASGFFTWQRKDHERAVGSALSATQDLCEILTSNKPNAFWEREAKIMHFKRVLALAMMQLGISSCHQQWYA